ncbi:MAG: hypothetical protein RL693_1545 [Verrucomicrobiota bacterium]|jgi:hypothetical protein
MRPLLSSSLPLALFLLLASSPVSAQTTAEPAPAPVPSASPAPSVSKLEQLESTYLFSLRRFHAPVLLDYQRELERLKQQLIAKSRPEDAKHVDAEIEYVKTLATTTGVLPYTALIPPPPVQPAPADLPPGPPLRRNKMPNAALSLNVAEASKTSLPLNAKVDGLPLGSIEWPVSKLPAGNYDVVMLFSCAALDKPEKITLNFAGKVSSTILPVERVTGADSSFRPYRIAKITFDQDVTDSTLSIQSEEPASPHLYIRGIALIRRD